MTSIKSGLMSGLLVVGIILITQGVHLENMWLLLSGSVVIGIYGGMK